MLDSRPCHVKTAAELDAEIRDIYAASKAIAPPIEAHKSGPTEHNPVHGW
jgi:hypothetical protein